MLKTLVLGVVCVIAGCHSNVVNFDAGSPSYRPHELEIEQAHVSEDDRPSQDLLDTPAPATVRNRDQLKQLPMTLEDAIQHALANSDVIRDLGGMVVSAPAAVSTVYDPAIQETSLQNGPQAALSAFDTQFSTSLYFNRSERTFNNVFFGGGAASLASNTGAFRTQLSKVSPTGTQFSLTHTVDYNRNNVGFNRFRSAYDGRLTGEFRHPLSFSPDYFRIAGANTIPGQYNGILLARINSDIRLADFEAAVRDLVRDVERLYWELYFGYRDLDAKVGGRSSTLGTWELQKLRLQVGNGTKDDEAQARQQYFLAQAAVQNTTSGNVQGTTGVFGVERQLRRLLGMPVNDGKLIVPITEPTMADVRFDWSLSLGQALSRRVELRRQQWAIRQRELELIAARNFDRMRVDFVGQYSWLGFGDELLGSGGPNHSVYQDLLGGDLQGWQLGFEVSSPVGNRIGRLAVRNAELRLSRDRSLLRTQQEQVVSDLKGAFVELDRAYSVTRTFYNRYRATLDQLATILKRHEKRAVPTDFVLAAQQRVVEAEIQYHRSVVDYNLALTNVHYTRGSLLDYFRVQLSEGDWTAGAHESAARIANKLACKELNYCINDSYLVGGGVHEQFLDGDLAEPESSDDTASETPAEESSDGSAPLGNTTEEIQRPVDVFSEPIMR